MIAYIISSLSINSDEYFVLIYTKKISNSVLCA